MKLQRRKRKLMQVTYKELAEFRTHWHNVQKAICPLLKKKVPFDKIALDHKHKRKKDPVGPNGDGLIRGVVQLQANALEGKIINNFKRLGLEKHIDLPSFLRNLADYLEHPPIPQMYIHPNEIKKPRVLNKQKFNTLKKKYKEKYPRRKPLAFPKSKKLTKNLALLFKEFNIKPTFKKE